MFSNNTEGFFSNAIKSLDSKKIVIIGDGPIALAQAIALKRKGLDVSIVGPRLNENTLSGNYSPFGVLESLNALIYPYKIVETPASHLKDISNQLDKIVDDLGIPCHKKAFSRNIDKKHIEIINKKTKQISTLDADLVFDCSGTSRVCLNDINEKRPNTFTFNKSPDESHTSFAQLRTILTPKEKELVRDPGNLHPMVYALGIEELREMGWNEFTIPGYYSQGNVKVKNSQKDERKVLIYTEIPPGMSDRECEVYWLSSPKSGNYKESEDDHLYLYQNEQSVFYIWQGKPNYLDMEQLKPFLTPELFQNEQKAEPCKNRALCNMVFNMTSERGHAHRTKIEKFMRIILKMARNDPKDFSLPTLKIQHDSRKWGNSKRMVSAFKAQPTFTTPGFYMGDAQIPTTFHAGDATLNLPFYTGSSLSEGAKRCKASNEALIIKGGILLGIDMEKYNQSFKTINNSAKNRINDNLYRDSYGIAEWEALEKYKCAYKQCVDSVDKIKITKSLQILYFKRIIKFRNELEGLKTDELGLSKLENNAEYFQFPFIREHFKAEEQAELNAAQKKFSSQCEKIGDKYPELAVNFYSLALKVLQQIPKSNVEEIIILYSKLMKAQENNIDTVLELADAVNKNYLSLSSSSEKEQKDEEFNKIKESISYYKITALIKKADILLNASDKDRESIKELVLEIEKTLPLISFDYAIQKQYQTFKDKHSDILNDILADTPIATIHILP